MDRCCGFQMPVQSESGLRSFVHRFEGDKLRLVWSKFLRELKTTEFSEELWCFRLKQQHIARELAKKKRNPLALSDVPPIGDETPHVAGAALDAEDRGEDALLDLPEFPCIDWDSFDVLADGDAGPPPLPPPYKPPPSPVLVEVMSSVSPEREHYTENHDIALLDGEGYPLPSAEFTELHNRDLPPGREDVQPMSRRQNRQVFEAARPAMPSDMESYISKLASNEPLGHKEFMNVIGAMTRSSGKASLKRPAAAMVAIAADETVPERVPATVPKERPTAAMAASETAASDATLLKDCAGYITDGSLVAPRNGKRVHSWQRKTNVFQIRDNATKQIVVQTTDRQSGGSKEKAEHASNILMQMWQAGASKAELQQMKAQVFGLNVIVKD
jgi:hypothetical protein